MIAFIYGILESVGFAHPLHPALTHIPMGMVMGAVIFRVMAVFSPLKHLSQTGYHCAVVALLGAPPTILFGWMDWQYRYGGQWEFLIGLKMILALAMLVILGLIVAMDDPDSPKLDLRSFLYLLALLNAIGLGFAGGELIYG